MPIEDFTSWSRTDTQSRLTVTAYTASWSNLLRTDRFAYIYDSQAFDDFITDFAFRLTSVTRTASYIERMNLVSYVNNISNYTDMVTAKNVAIGLMVVGDSAEAAAGEYQVRAYEIKNDGTENFGSRVKLNVNQTYYARVIKSGTSLIIRIYSNPGRSVLVGSSTRTLAQDYDFFYVMGTQCYGGSTNGYASSGSISNLILDLSNTSKTLAAEFLPRATLTDDIVAEVNVTPHNAEQLVCYFTLRQATENLLAVIQVGPIIYSDGSEEVYCKFRVDQGPVTSYDLSDTSGIGFSWWGPTGHDHGTFMADFEVETPTGNYKASFAEGYGRWIWVGFPWDEMDIVGLTHGESKPDLSQVEGFLWTYHTPGTRKLGVLGVWVPNDLLSEFIVRHSASENLQCEFTLQDPNETLYSKFFVQNSFTHDITAEFQMGYRADIYSQMLLRQLTSTRFATFTVAQGTHDMTSEFTLPQRGEGDVQGVFLIRQDTEDLVAEFEVSNMRDFYVSTLIAQFMNPRYIASDHYKIEGRTSVFGNSITSLISWNAWLSGTIQADINLDPPTNEEISLALGWSPAIMGDRNYAVLTYTTGSGWLFVTSFDGNNVETTDVTAHLDFDQHEIRIVREAPSGPYPDGRFLLYIDGTQRAAHSTDVPISTDHITAFFGLAQMTTDHANEKMSVDIDNIILPS